MALIEFKDLPDTSTPLNSANLNNNFNEVNNKIGDLTQLETTDKTNIVNAINGVVESGSNDNGKWIKYANGTMIETNTKYVDSLTSSRQIGQVYLSDAISLPSFPIPFIEVPTMVAYWQQADWANCRVIGITNLNYTTETEPGNIILYCATSNTQSGGFVNYTAIGRWK